MNELLIDVLLVVLLSGCITWCAIVHRRLKKIGFERADIVAFLTSVETVVEKAEDAIGRMKTTCAELGDRADVAEQEAADRLDELTRLIASATRVSQRLEASLNQSYRKLAEDRVRADAPPEEPARPSLAAAHARMAREVAEQIQSKEAVRPAPVEVQEEEPSLLTSLKAPPAPAAPAAPRAEPFMASAFQEREAAPGFAKPRHRSTVNSILDRLTRQSGTGFDAQPSEAV